MTAAQFPSNETRIVYSADGTASFSEFCMETTDPQEIKAILEDNVDEMAAGGVDALSLVVWCRFIATLGVSTVAPDPNPWDPAYVILSEAGIDPTDVLIDRCHENGMDFIAGFRMNDRHGGPVGRFINEHPEWHLNVGGGPPVDYAYEPVRQKILDFIEELLVDHDVDGIELDWMRWCHMFEPGTGAQKAHFLTDFTRKARELLDAAAQRRGRRRLILEVRVPQTLEECDYLGFDLASWIAEGLVDYVVPSDYKWTDFNTKVEEFVKLAEGSDCKIYPAIHPRFCEGNDTGPATLANYRAAARNFYAYGADGVEAYNYQYHWGRHLGRTTPWPSYMWPAALAYLGKLADPQEIAQHDRHYLFYPLWTAYGGAGWGQTGHHDDRIFLDRAKGDLPGSQQFRVAEDLSDRRLRATLQFKAVGMGKYEALEIQLNGTVVPDNYTFRQFYSDGQNEWQGRPLDAFYEYKIELDRRIVDPPLINGDNELTVRLIPTAGQSEGTVTIEDLEVYVYVREAR